MSEVPNENIPLGAVSSESIDVDDKVSNESIDIDDDNVSISMEEPTTTKGKDDEEAAVAPKRKKQTVLIQVVFVVFSIYCFLVGLQLMGDAFKALAGDAAGNLFSFVDNPVAGLMVGLIATALVQSSSTSTSIVVTMVGSGILSVTQAIPVIMGTNIGTSITSTAVALVFAENKENYRRGFAGATVHDIFNYLTVLVFLPLEVIVNAINGGNGGFLEIITRAIVSTMEITDGDKWVSPFKAIVSPVTSLFIKIDKSVLKDWSFGIPNLEKCTSGLNLCALAETTNECLPYAFQTKSSDCEALDYVYECAGSKPSFLICQFQNGTYTVNETITESAQDYYNNLNILKGGVFYTNGIDPYVAGIVTLLISLVLLVGSLIALVKLLQKLLLHTSEDMMSNALNMNGYLAMLVGCGATVLVQSSSVTTSTLTPLVAVGVISLETMFPFTIGANVGTTITAILASIVSGEAVAVQIALCHLFFNLCGMVSWYPIPFMRRIPLSLATKIGDIAADISWFPIFYICMAFIFYPLSVLGISALFENLVPLAIILLVVLIAAHAWFYYFIKRQNGYQQILEFVNKKKINTDEDSLELNVN